MFSLINLGNFDFVNIYAPCSTLAKRGVWAELLVLKQNLGEGEWCIVGDFNAITCAAERKGRSGASYAVEMANFNNFIVDMDLIDVQMTGKKFSYFCSDGVSMSRLDRFLISEGLIALWGYFGSVDWQPGHF